MKLDATDDQNNTYFLEELFPDNTLIYRVIVREGEQRTVKLFRTSYIVNGEGNIEFTGTPQQVKKEISYINVNLNLNTKTMERTTKKPCCPDKVNALIAHKETEFTEDHREWLLTQSSEMIESLTPKEEKVIEVNKKVDAPIEAKEVTKEQAINALKDLSADEFMQLMPAEMREQTQHGLNIHQQHKDNMVKAILDNTDKDVWDEKELKAMPIETLSKIAKGLTKEPITEIVDYSANGNSPVVQSEVVEPMFPGGVTEEKKEKE